MNENLITNSQGIPKKVTSVPYLLILICFLFPFIEVSCQGHKMMSLTGYQAAFGTEIQQPDFGFGGSPKTQKLHGTPAFVLVLVCAVVAAVVGLFHSIVAAVFGGIGALLMFVAKASIDRDAVREGQGILAVSYGGGFYLTLLLLAVGITLCILSHKQRRKHGEI